MINNHLIKVFDFFSGCGGTAKGFASAGMDIVFAIDTDHDALVSFVNNIPNVKLKYGNDFKGEDDKILSSGEVILKNIKDLPVETIRPIINSCNGYALLFSGCAPCQPFSKQKTILPDEDDRVILLDEFRRFTEHYLPEFIFIENVPGLQNVAGENGPFYRFINFLKDNGYFYKYKVVASKKYGVPQNRRRLILIASKLARIEFPQESHGPGTINPKYSTSKEWISGLTELKAGEIDKNDPVHRTASLSETNLLRINATPIGGSRMDWPKELWLPCHSNGYLGHTDVYGRMKWDAPATALTTKCHSLSNGRFGHPEQPRAISIREAACLQTFSRIYTFEGGIQSMARQIGNAVPVILAQRFGDNFNDNLKQYMKENHNGEI